MRDDRGRVESLTGGVTPPAHAHCDALTPSSLFVIERSTPVHSSYDFPKHSAHALSSPLSQITSAQPMRTERRGHLKKLTVSPVRRIAVHGIIPAIVGSNLFDNSKER